MKSMIIVGDGFTVGRGLLGRVRRFWADFICAVIGHVPYHCQSSGVYIEPSTSQPYNTAICARCWKWGYFSADVRQGS